MSSMNKGQVSEIAQLARIEITGEEAEKMARECGAILGYISELNQIAAKDTEPIPSEVHNVMRNDSEPHEGGVFTDVILKEMPETKDGYLKVKKILG